MTVITLMLFLPKRLYLYSYSDEQQNTFSLEQVAKLRKELFFSIVSVKLK